MTEFPQTNPEIAPTGEIQYIHDNLDAPNWAPWLTMWVEDHIAHRDVFPDGQLVIKDEQTQLPIGVLTTNQIQWDGNSESLPTWDGVAGEDYSFRETYKSDGNTLCLMAISIAQGHKGEHLPEQLIGKLKELGTTKNVEHIIGDFRPSGFGEYKRLTGSFDFDEYVALRREDGLPEDPWLRNLTRQGMQPLRADYRAMVMPFPLAELREYQTSYNPENWYQVTDQAAHEVLVKTHDPVSEIGEFDEIWECGETGTWYVNSKTEQAVYIESNYYGELPIAS